MQNNEYINEFQLFVKTLWTITFVNIWKSAIDRMIIIKAEKR